MNTCRGDTVWTPVSDSTCGTAFGSAVPWRWFHLPFAEPGVVLLGPAPGCADTGGNDNAVVRFRASPTLGRFRENAAVFRKAVRGRTTSAPTGRRFGLQRRGWAAPGMDCTNRAGSVGRDSPCLTKVCFTCERIVLF